MAKLRIEFTTLGGARGRLGGQIDAREARALGATTLDVSDTPTPTGQRPTTPSGLGTVFAELTADAPVYVDIGPAPDPTSEPRLLVIPGRMQRIHVDEGRLVSAVLAGDAPFRPDPVAVTMIDRSGIIAAGGTAQQACAANASRRLLLASNPDQSRTLWLRTDGVATPGAGSLQLGPGGAFVFDKVVPAGAISIIGAATGQPFTVQEA